MHGDTQIGKLTRPRYAPACIKLLAQYKSLMKLVSEEIGSLDAFMKRFKVCLLFWKLSSVRPLV